MINVIMNIGDVMNEIVKYNNNFNNIGLRNFNANELDILMAICSRMREKGEEEITFHFDKLKKLIKYSDKTNTFVKDLENTYDKLISIKLKIGDKRKFVKFVLFTRYSVNSDSQTIDIAVNKDFAWVLNELNVTFTSFELQEFIELKSSYSKEFYRRMKQFKTTGIWKVSIEEFKQILDIPSSYKASDIDKRVLMPIENELGKKHNLKIKKRYSSKGRGRPTVSGFEFKFNKEISPGKTKIIGEINFNIFAGRKVRMYDSIYDRYNVMTILSIEGKEMPAIRLQNVDDGYIQEFAFNSSEHFMNWFEKNKI